MIRQFYSRAKLAVSSALAAMASAPIQGRTLLSTQEPIVGSPTLRRLGTVKRDTSVPKERRQRHLPPGGHLRVFRQFRNAEASH
jgi:hypothetical protein